MQSLKNECAREQSLSTQEEAKKVIAAYEVKYNKQCLHSTIGYVKPLAKLNGEDGKTACNVELAVCQPLANVAESIVGGGAGSKFI